VLIQGSTLGPLIRLVLKPSLQEQPAPKYQELEARMRVVMASLRYLEEAAGHGRATPHHGRLVEDYRRRLEMTRQIGDMGEQSLQLRASHFGTALAALAAGRAELIQLHHSGVIHDSIVRELESELDLEELRLRRLAGEFPA
jgi:CPA1 family monovalent cation:H+ antiporter